MHGLGRVREEERKMRWDDRSATYTGRENQGVDVGERRSR
jgi:hypothetical protein